MSDASEEQPKRAAALMSLFVEPETFHEGEEVSTLAPSISPTPHLIRDTSLGLQQRRVPSKGESESDSDIEDDIGTGDIDGTAYGSIALPPSSITSTSTSTSLPSLFAPLHDSDNGYESRDLLDSRPSPLPPPPPPPPPLSSSPPPQPPPAVNVAATTTATATPAMKRRSTLTRKWWKLVEFIAASFVFLTLQLAFIISMGATTNNVTSFGVLASMTLLSTTGSLICGAVTIFTLKKSFPALLICTDLFTAPLVVNIATKITTHDKTVFLPTLTVAISIGLSLTAILCILSLRFKILNFNNFLPSQVVSGLMSGVGVSILLLACRLDTGETLLNKKSLYHIPSFVVGAFIFGLGRKSPFVLPAAMLLVTGAAYFVTYVVFDVDLKRARQLGFFWTPEMFAFKNEYDAYSPPLPFSFWFYLSHVNWGMIGKASWR